MPERRAHCRQALPGLHRRARRLTRPRSPAAGFLLALLLGPWWLPAASAAAKQRSHGGGADRLPAGFVALHDVAPRVVEELRYAGPDNFTGAPVPGYPAASRCVLTRPAAMALAKVQKRLEEWGLGLKVFDCLRPQQAVAHFVAWSEAATPGASPGARAAGEAEDPQQRRRTSAPRDDYLPRVKRGDAFRLGYLARRSGHTRGNTVDLTVVPLDTVANAPRDKGPACNLPAKGPLRDGELDLGTGFDCLDPTAHTKNPNVSPAARAHRFLLVELMRAAGFVNYPVEWWHFTLAGRRGGPRDDDAP